MKSAFEIMVNRNAVVHASVLHDDKAICLYYIYNANVMQNLFYVNKNKRWDKMSRPIRFTCMTNCGTLAHSAIN